MTRRLIFIAAAAAVLVVGSAVLSGYAADKHAGHAARTEPGTRPFVGYWMGIDPLDGGDSRRGITPDDDRTLAIIGRDTVFTLCDDTDRAIVTADDARLVGSALVSDDLVITCTNDGSVVRLKVRYDLIDRNIVRETVTTQDGGPVDEIIFHRVSAPTF